MSYTMVSPCDMCAYYKRSMETLSNQNKQLQSAHDKCSTEGTMKDCSIFEAMIDVNIKDINRFTERLIEEEKKCELFKQYM